jgi:hypothetical protein
MHWQTRRTLGEEFENGQSAIQISGDHTVLSNRNDKGFNRQFVTDGAAGFNAPVKGTPGKEAGQHAVRPSWARLYPIPQSEIEGIEHGERAMISSLPV